jgi:hypothetical protein
VQDQYPLIPMSPRDSPESQQSTLGGLHLLADRWAAARAAERAAAQAYSIELCEALELPLPQPAGSGYEFEFPMMLASRDGTETQSAKCVGTRRAAPAARDSHQTPHRVSAQLSIPIIAETAPELMRLARGRRQRSSPSIGAAMVGRVTMKRHGNSANRPQSDRPVRLGR